MECNFHLLDFAYAFFTKLPEPSVSKVVHYRSPVNIPALANLPKRMGFEDRGRYDLFLDIKHKTGTAFDETKARQFVDILVAGLAKALYAGWQESELKCNDIVTDIKTLADGDDFVSLGISENADLVETLLKRLVQHYAIE